LRRFWAEDGVSGSTYWEHGMNWEESRVLTPLKHDFLVAFFERGNSFFLTGGSALGVFYLDHRFSFDLDFFTTDDALDWHVLDNEIRSISRALSASCKSVTSAPTFRRYELNREDEREILDFVIELVPQVDIEKELIGNLRVDTLREIMLNKICTLIGRCEIKDVVDLYFLDKKGLKVAEHLEAASRKEGGLDPAMMSFILDRMQIDEIPDYVLKPVTVEDLRSFIETLRATLADIAFPERNA
jgi:hypothetical protein